MSSQLLIVDTSSLRQLGQTGNSGGQNSGDSRIPENSGDSIPISGARPDLPNHPSSQ